MCSIVYNFWRIDMYINIYICQPIEHTTLIQLFQFSQHSCIVKLSPLIQIFLSSLLSHHFRFVSLFFSSYFPHTFSLCLSYKYFRVYPNSNILFYTFEKLWLIVDFSFSLKHMHSRIVLVWILMNWLDFFSFPLVNFSRMVATCVCRYMGQMEFFLLDFLSK